MNFSDRISLLPTLGIGISTEFEFYLTAGALDIEKTRTHFPNYAKFLEIGVIAEQGIDDLTSRWIKQRLPVTFHFLDLNLGDMEDFDGGWISKIRSLVSLMRPVWICGDAGQWHFNRREPAHSFLQPPILTKQSAREIADGIIHLREITGLEVFPENPPGTAFVGNMHLMDFFATVCELADTGMVLDCTHLGMYQFSQGFPAMYKLNNFPFERVVEVHVAGSKIRQDEDYSYIEDDHRTHILPETWQIFEEACRRGKNIRAVVLEGEYNEIDKVLPVFRQIEGISAEYNLFKGE